MAKIVPNLLGFLTLLIAVNGSSDDVKRYIVGDQEQAVAQETLTVTHEEAEAVRRKFTREDIEALRTLIQAWETGEADIDTKKHSRTPSHDGYSDTSRGHVRCGVSKVARQEERIVGGKQAEAHAWPWQISLRRRDAAFVHFCAGSVISERWVITAAHCVTNEAGKLTPASKLAVLVGAHHKDYEYEEEGRQYRDVIRIVANDGYPNNHQDIALLELNKDLRFTEQVQPICLPDGKEEVRSETLCTVTGWGDTKGTGSSEVLREANVPIMARELCARKDFYGPHEINNYMLCAGRVEGGVDSCQGDSGGPLVCPGDNGAYELCGITSWGNGCAEKKKPGVYTNVARLMPWVKQHMQGRIYRASDNPDN